MPSTRTNMTVAFVIALLAITAAIGLTVWTVRNETVYRDVARYAVTQADLAANLIREAGEEAQKVVVSPDTAAEALSITPRLIAMLDVFSDYVVVLDRHGNALYQSPAMRRLSSADSLILDTQLPILPVDSAAVITLPDVKEKLLVVARNIQDSTAILGHVVVGAPTSDATQFPRAYRILFFVIAPLFIALAGWRAYAAYAITSQRVARITHDVAAITDGRSLHRRLNIQNAGQEFEELVDTLNAMIARLETSFMGLRRFTADASHELKTPLAVLRADVERAMSEPISKSERMVALEEA
ncbi:MAG TPA: hypothetical protein VIF83_11870, partial [Gemmatimonadaceae bacterium]